jgi:large subunit ribosomal protein L9
MKVLFIKSVRGKGAVGDIKEVPDGYAMNFLINKGFAVKATDVVIKEHQARELAKHESSQQQEDSLKQKFHELRGTIITLHNIPKDLKGNLYKGIKPEEIISEIRKQKNVFLDLTVFKEYDPIKHTGDHTLILSGKNNSVQITIQVT